MTNWQTRLGPLLVSVWQGKRQATETHRLVCEEISQTHVFDERVERTILRIIMQLEDHEDGVNTSTTIEAIGRCNLIPRQNVSGSKTDACS